MALNTLIELKKASGQPFWEHVTVIYKYFLGKATIQDLRQKETQDCWIIDPDFDEAVRLGSSATSSQQFDSDVVDDGSWYCTADTVVNMGRQIVNNEMAWLGSDATFQQPRDRWFKSRREVDPGVVDTAIQKWDARSASILRNGQNSCSGKRLYARIWEGLKKSALLWRPWITRVGDAAMCRSAIYSVGAGRQVMGAQPLHRPCTAAESGRVGPGDPTSHASDALTAPSQAPSKITSWESDPSSSTTLTTTNLLWTASPVSPAATSTSYATSAALSTHSQIQKRSWPIKALTMFIDVQPSLKVTLHSSPRWVGKTALEAPNISTGSIRYDKAEFLARKALRLHAKKPRAFRPVKEIPD
ncbi:hypothetical protein B0H19DRAFT_1244350 [Mycena capillaripes]|nr:hypothetical protein B0H19DRAFT_1244350 [Mycena capillaripes]